LEFWPETGALSGGPGWVKTIRYGESLDLEDDQKKSDLMHVEVHFDESVRGNLENHDITFLGNVHTFAGPVQHWRDRLDPDIPNGLGKDGVEIFSDQLRAVEFRENQLAPFIEMIADGNVEVHHAQFSASGDRLSYNDAKDLLILKAVGAGRLATVKSVFKGIPSQGKGQEIHVWPKRKHVAWENIQRIDFGGFGPRQQRP
jgi:hypothetical protein